MQETELTPAAREAIRSYMLRVLALPGVVLTIAGFLVGFLVNDVARKTAYNEAYREASAVIRVLYTEAAEAEVKTEVAATKIEDLLEEAREITVEADTIRGQLRTAEAFQKSEDIVKKVAAELVERNDIAELIVKSLTEQITDLENRLDNLNKKAVKIKQPYHIQVPEGGELVVRKGSRQNAAPIVFATARKETWQFVP